jgi:hypothetical protein
VFCLPQHLESYAADAFGRLAAADRLRGLARDPFITGLAGFLADINALHPFREATAAPSGRSSPSSPMTPGITSPGCLRPRRVLCLVAALLPGFLMPASASRYPYGGRPPR